MELSGEAGVTQRLQTARGGDARAFDGLVARVYDDLRRLAHQVGEGP